MNNLVAAAVEDTGRENRDTHSNRRDKSSSAKGSSTSRETKGPKLCYACGKPHPGDCMLRNHPDANTDPSIPWIESKYGKLYGLQIPPGTNLPNTGSIADPNWRNPNLMTLLKSKAGIEVQGQRNLNPSQRRIQILGFPRCTTSVTCIFRTI